MLSVSDTVYAAMLPGGGSSGPPPAPAPDYPGAGRGGGGAEERRGRSRTAERPRQGVVRRIRSSGPAGPGPAPDMGRSLHYCETLLRNIITDGSTTCTTYDKVSWSHGLSHRSLVSSADSLVKTKSAIMSEQSRTHSRGVTLLSI